MNNEKPQLVDTGSGFSVLYLNKYLYSRKFPEDKANLIAENIQWENNTLYILASPLLFYGVLHLIKKCPENSLIIALETNQSLMRISLDHFPPELKHKIAFIRTESFEKLYHFLKEKKALHYRRCRILSLNQGYRLHKNKYDELAALVNQSLINYWNNRATEIRLGALWIKNSITNLLSFDQYFDLESLKTEKAVYVCGAGESLEKSLPEIRDNRNSIFLLCVDTALNALLTSGIKPDAVINLESQIYNYSDFTHPEAKNIPFISDISAYPASLRISRQNYIFLTDYYNHSLHKRILESGLIKTIIPPLGSVGITALAIAEKLTDREIFFTGLDFAYIPGKTHSRGTPYHNLQLNESSRINSLYRYATSINRPLTDEHFTDDPYRRTDRILKSYAEQTDDFLSGKKNIFNQGNLGVPLKTPKGCLQQLQTDEEHKDFSPGIYHKRIDDFLKKEHSLLQAVEENWDLYTKEESGKSLLLESIEEVDYIYFSFADRDQNIKETSSFLTRAVLEARKLRLILERAG